MGADVGDPDPRRTSEPAWAPRKTWASRMAWAFTGRRRRHRRRAGRLTTRRRRGRGRRGGRRRGRGCRADSQRDYDPTARRYQRSGARVLGHHDRPRLPATVKPQPNTHLPGSRGGCGLSEDEAGRSAIVTADRLDGLVVKLRIAPYRGRRDPAWVKVTWVCRATVLMIGWVERHRIPLEWSWAMPPAHHRSPSNAPTARPGRASRQ